MNSFDKGQILVYDIFEKMFKKMSFQMPLEEAVLLAAQTNTKEQAIWPYVDEALLYKRVK